MPSTSTTKHSLSTKKSRAENRRFAVYFQVDHYAGLCVDGCYVGSRLHQQSSATLALIVHWRDQEFYLELFTLIRQGDLVIIESG